MNHILKKIYDFFLTLDEEQFYKYSLMYVAGLLAICVGILFFYYSTLYRLNNSISSLHKTKIECTKTLDNLKAIANKKALIKNILDEEKNFKIKNYYDEIIKELGLDKNERKEAEVTEEEIEKNQYNEIKLTSQLQGISMKNLCELLEDIEKKKRLYIKDLIITKGRGPTIDINIVIATLKQISFKE